MALHHMRRIWKEKNNAKVQVYNFNKLRRCGKTRYFGPQPKLGGLGTDEDNPIDLSDGGED